MPVLRAQAAEPPARSVLLFQSYQQGAALVQHLTDGVLSVLSKSREFTFTYRFEYMNIHDTDQSAWTEVYRRQLGAHRFDIVICADSLSLEFLVDNRSQLSPGVPIVFCNIDDFSPGMLKGESGITGVTSELDFEGTIELAGRLHPDMRRLVVLASRRLAAQSPAYARLLEVVRYRELAGRLQVEYWEDPKLSDLIARAGTFPPDTVVLDMAFIAEDPGTPVGLLSSTRRASEALGLPFYSCWESLLDNGIVGGMISGSFQQGEAAGKLALQILRGADPDNLPVVRNGTSRAMIDYAQLERFRIPERRLPRGSIVINRPLTLYERFPGTFWAFVTAIAALAVLLAVSWLYIVSQQRLKRGLRQSEERLSLALAAAASGIWEYYPKTRKAYYDNRWYTMLGYEPGALPPEYGSWVDLLHPDDRVRAEGAVQRYVDEGKDFTVEFRLRSRDGRWLWISSSGKIVERDAAGSALRIVGTHVDISERRKTQAELEQANLNLERRVGERTRELAALNEFDNVYYEICNEPYFGDTTALRLWEAHMTGIVVDAENDFTNKHLISNNIANHHRAVGEPREGVSVYNFHYARPPITVGMNYHLNKPIGDNETGFDGIHDATYRMEAWNFILAGGALFNHLDYSFTVGHEDGSFMFREGQPGGGGAADRPARGRPLRGRHGIPAPRGRGARGLARDRARPRGFSAYPPQQERSPPHVYIVVIFPTQYSELWQGLLR